MGLTDGPLDLSINPSQWALALKNANAGTQSALGGAPAAGAPDAVHQSPPALVESPKVAPLKSTTSEGTPLDGSPLDMGQLGAEQRQHNISPAPAYGQHDLDAAPAMAPIVSGTPKSAADLKPAPTPFHSFLSTMRDVATGRPSDPDSVAGTVRGGLGHLSHVLRDASIAVGGPELMLRQKEAEANRALARTQMESLNQYRQGQLGIAGKKATTAEEKVSQTEPITVQEGDVYHTQLGVKPGTVLRPQDIAGLLKNKETLESKESEGAAARQSALERTETTTRYKTTPSGLYDTKTGRLIPDTGAGIPITPEVAMDYGLPREAVGKLAKPGELAQLRRAQGMFATKTTEGGHYVADADGNPVWMPDKHVVTPTLPGGRTPGAPQGPPAPFNPQAGAPSTETPQPTAPRAPGGMPAAGSTLPGVHLKNPQMVFGTDDQGKQVAGSPAELRASGVANFNPLPSSEVAKVNTARQITSPGGLFDLAKQDLSKISDADMNVIGSRWQEFKRGAIGKGDPRFTKLYSHVKGLLATAVAQVHVGANGSTEMMEHFSKIADSTFMDKKTLQAALEGEREYMDEKAMRPQKAGVKEGGMIRARDPQGKLHEAPAGTALPANWKKE